MKQLFARLEQAARHHPQRILFPEGDDPRILSAISYLVRRNLVCPILFAKRSSLIRQWPASSPLLRKVVVLDPGLFDFAHHPSCLSYVHDFIAIRKKKGKPISLALAKKLFMDPMYFAVMMLACGEVDGIVAGATWPTPRTLRPAFQILRKKKELVSSFFLMKHQGEFYFFADCAINVNPSSNDLASIALSTAQSAKNLLHVQPRVALLSFSTHGSTVHPLSEKVREATVLVRKKDHALLVDGELQADAALKPAIGKYKSKLCFFSKPANVLIFPSLEAANIAYKLVEWLGHYEAVGPISQNLAKPVNDLSRGCTADDIIKVSVITALQAQQANRLGN
ncbi:phosphotransacetylase [Candidatus Woesearchaeota archaeon]|nr:phosphotransacetylase [Candidatus Woesearchaeota archaeon]